MEFLCTNFVLFLFCLFFVCLLKVQLITFLTCLVNKCVCLVVHFCVCATCHCLRMKECRKNRKSLWNTAIYNAKSTKLTTWKYTISALAEQTATSWNQALMLGNCGNTDYAFSCCWLSYYQLILVILADQSACFATLLRCLTLLSVSLPLKLYIMTDHMRVPQTWSQNNSIPAL